MTDPRRKMELCWLLCEAMDRYGFLREAPPRPLETAVLAEIIDALAWHPYVNLDPRDGAAVLLRLVKTDRRLGKQIRQLAEDGFALSLVEHDDDLGVTVYTQGLEDLVIDLPDGTRVPLLTGLAAMLEGMKVTGFFVQTKPTGA